MKKVIGLAALLTLVAATTFTPNVSAQCNTGTGTNLLLKWDANGFSYETPANPVNHVSPAGNVLSVYTGVTLFCAPLTIANPNDPGTEYSYVMTGLVSQGTVTSPFGSGGTKWTTLYTGGSFNLYSSPVNSRSYQNSTVPVPALATPNYTDGPVQLSGSVDSLVVTITRSSSGVTNGSFRGRYQITGGPWADLFCQNVQAGLMNGLWNPNAPAAGWSAQVNGKLDAPACPVPTNPSTWGRIKSIYR